MSSSESTWPSDPLPLEGAKSCFRSYLGFPTNNGVFVVPNKQKRVSINYTTCAKVLKYAGNTMMLIKIHKNHDTIAMVTI